MRKVIMLGGIHGVGKSFLCKKIKDVNICEVYSASQLMRDYINENVDDNKKVEDIKLNQDILLNAIEEKIPNDIVMILDGHFCLINNYREIEEVPIDTFMSIGINAIIILISDADTIINRLSSRDSLQYSTDFINEFQNKEVDYATEIAKELSIQILICKNPVNDKEILNLINTIRENK